MLRPDFALSLRSMTNARRRPTCSLRPLDTFTISSKRNLNINTYRLSITILELFSWLPSISPTRSPVQLGYDANYSYRAAKRVRSQQYVYYTTSRSSSSREHRHRSVTTADRRLRKMPIRHSDDGRRSNAPPKEPSTRWWKRMIKVRQISLTSALIFSNVPQKESLFDNIPAQ